MQISVIVVNYNGREFLKQCLDALTQYTTPDSEIIVVDDASTDGSFEMVRSKFPQIVALQHNRNKGPTAARNTGSKLAKGEFLVFCDSDALINSGTIPQLVECLVSRPEVAVVGARVVPQGEEFMWWNFGYFPNYPREIPGFFLGWLSKFKGLRFLQNFASLFVLNYVDYSKSRGVDWVVEKCFAARRQIFEQVGRFDEKFFMFMEGPDLCKRIKEKGGQIWYLSQAEVIALPHFTHPEKRKIIFENSERYYHQKHSSLYRISPFLWQALRAIKGYLYHLAEK